MFACRYAVNLVVFFVDKNLPGQWRSMNSGLLETFVFSLASFVKLGCYGIAEIPDRSSVGASLLLPVSNKDKDSWNKEENHKLLNGNSVDPMDRVCRSFQSRFC